MHEQWRRAGRPTLAVCMRTYRKPHEDEKLNPGSSSVKLNDDH